MPSDENNLLVEEARIIFRNFQGKATEYNDAGQRNFGLILDALTADKLITDCWNVKFLKVREEGDEPQAWLPVTVSYRNYPPKIVMITSKGRTELGDDMVEILDWADIKKIDVIVRPYHWTHRGEGGIKAYVKTMFVTINEDYLELKYANEDYIPARAGRIDE